MPIYEYDCEKCGAHHELLQRMDDKPLTRCPACKGKVHKAISRSSFQLKGAGWYVTDYAKKSGGPAGGESSSESKSDKPEKSDASESKSEAKSETKAETKTQAKSESKPAKTEKKNAKSE